MPDPSIIMDLAVAYRSSMVLFSATELGIFTHLAEGPLDAATVADRCGGHPRPTRLLLNNCVAYGLLEQDGDRYINTAASAAFLVEGGKAFIGSGLKYAEDLYPAWGQLTDLVRTNEPVVPATEYTGDDPDKTRNFVYGMHNRALGFSAALPYGVDLTGRKQMLDIGGGPGTYSIILVKATPGLQSTVLDLPGVVAIAGEIIESYGLSDRITTQAGSYLTDDFKKGNDVVLMSGMLHRETGETCRGLLRKAYESLESGGLVVVSDVFFDDERHVSPTFAAHFALNMMLTSADGATHGKTEMAAWMEGEGFGSVQVKDLPKPNPHSLVIGSKP
jgi:hypothetical protein